MFQRKSHPVLTLKSGNVEVFCQNGFQKMKRWLLRILADPLKYTCECGVHFK